MYSNLRRAPTSGTQDPAWSWMFSFGPHWVGFLSTANPVLCGTLFSSKSASECFHIHTWQADANNTWVLALDERLDPFVLEMAGFL